MRKALVLGVFGLAGTLAAPAFAAEDFSGFRLGMTASQDLLEGDFAIQGLGVQPVNTNRLGYGIFAGWGLNRYFAIESSLKSGSNFNSNGYPDFVESISFVPPGLPDRAAFFKIDNDVITYDITAVGSVWIGDKISFFGRLGGMGWSAETRYAYGDLDVAPKTVDAVKDTGFAPMGGLGIQSHLDGALVRLEYIYADVGDMGSTSTFGQFDNTISSVSFSVVWIIH